MNNNDPKPFTYTYSAKQQEEIRAIRQKYAAPEEDKLEQLRRLDGSVMQKALTVALTVGIFGALILGVGMSLTMTELGEILGTYRDLAMPLGIGIGLVGIVLVSLAYPLYNRTAKKERERIAAEVIRLTDELMK